MSWPQPVQSRLAEILETTARPTQTTAHVVNMFLRRLLELIALDAITGRPPT